MAKKTTKAVDEKVEGAGEEKVEAPKADKKLRVVGVYDGQQIDRVYEDADLAKQFCDKINNSGRNSNHAELK